MIPTRGPRVSAWITTAVLAVVLLTGSLWLLVAQAAVFALATVFGPHRSPYGLFYRYVVAPRLHPSDDVEPIAPVRFAQAVGLVFALVGVAGFATGLTPLGLGATAAAFVAAFLNAAFGYCLGCQLYVLLQRVAGAGVAAAGVSPNAGPDTTGRGAAA
jgi:hypothetical protein